MITASHPATAADVARHYDELDRFYRELWGEHVHHGLFERDDEEPQEATARLVSKVAELARLEPGDEVCDVGCGYGATARQLAAERGVRVTGLTISEAQVRFARDRAPPGSGLEFRKQDWLESDLPDASYDAVLAIECLAHMADPRRFFGEAVRTLRPGGRFVVCAWLASEGAGPLSRRLLLEPICRDGALVGIGTEGEYRAMMSEAGLRPEHFEDLTGRVRRTWAVSTRRLLSAWLRNPEYRKALRDPALLSRGFARAVLRIRIAYRVGAMRYGIFGASKPAGAGPADSPDTPQSGSANT